MKNTKICIFIIALLICNIKLYSQNSEPTALPMTYKVDSTYYTNQPLDVNIFKQTNFKIGWQWYGNPYMTRALKMNMNEL